MRWDPGPMMDLLGVPGMIRRFAPKNPTQEIKLNGEVFTITTDGQRSATQTLNVDGKTESRFEVMGKPVKAIARVKAGVLILTGVISMNGGAQPFESTRRRAGDVMTLETVAPQGVMNLSPGATAGGWCKTFFAKARRCATLGAPKSRPSKRPMSAGLVSPGIRRGGAEHP